VAGGDGYSPSGMALLTRLVNTWCSLS
jgi:hypothetical protein